MGPPNPDDRSFPDWIETVYEVLEAHLSEREDGVSPAAAQEIVLETTAEELGLSSSDAEYAIQRLLDRGYLYEVDGELFVTESEADG